MGAFLLLRTVMAMYNSGILLVGARSTAIAILLRYVLWPGRPIARAWPSAATMEQSRSGSYPDQLLTSHARQSPRAHSRRRRSCRNVQALRLCVQRGA